MKFLYAIAFVVCGLISTGIVLWVNQTRYPPLTTQEQSLLRSNWDDVTGGNWSPWMTEPSGRVVWDPANAYDAWIETYPEDQRAWTVINDTYLLWKNMDEQAREAGGSFPYEHAEWDRYSSYLLDAQTVLLIDSFAAACFRPVLGEPSQGSDHATNGSIELHANEPKESIFLSNTSQYSLGYGLALLDHFLASAHIELEQGDSERAMRLISACSHLAQMFIQIPTDTAHRTRLRFNAKLGQHLRYAISMHASALSNDQLLELKGMVENLNQDLGNPSRWALEIEDILRHPDGLTHLNDGSAYILLDLVQRTVPAEPSHRLGYPSAKLSDQTQRSLYTVQAVALATNGLFESDDATTSRSLWLQTQQQLNQSDLPTKEMTNITESFLRLARRAKTEIQVTSISIALELFRREYGHFPNALDDLEQSFHLDWFTVSSRPRYKLTDQGPILYCYGIDGLDDQGKLLWGSRSYEVYSEYDEDTDSETLLYTVQVTYPMTPSRSVRSDWVYFPVPTQTSTKVEYESAAEPNPSESG